MNIFTVPIAIYCGTSYDKCTYCKSLWMNASAKCPKCKMACGVPVGIKNYRLHNHQVAKCEVMRFLNGFMNHI